MVTPEGLLPNKTITTSYIEQVYKSTDSLVDYVLTTRIVFRRSIWNLPSSFPLDLPNYAQLEQHL